MLSDRFPHCRQRPAFILGAALLACLLVTGCHPDADSSPASVSAAADVPNPVADVPKSFPPTPAVFQTVMP